ncbi:MAG: four helix bundle protein [Deltaproteobacteria bacterium]|nr:four helix bundle protein [Deltaproteobacteria bacterium]
MEKEKLRSRSYRDLEVWKLSIELVKEIYRITNEFPVSELYGLTNQVRRAAVSIPANIAEGQARSSPKEFKQFLSVAFGSAAELETHLIISKEVNYLSTEIFEYLMEILERIMKMVKGLSSKI